MAVFRQNFGGRSSIVRQPAPIKFTQPQQSAPIQQPQVSQPTYQGNPNDMLQFKGLPQQPGMGREILKGLIMPLIKTGYSAWDTGQILADMMDKTSNYNAPEYSLPGLGKFRSYTGDAKVIGDQYVAGEKPMSAVVGSLARPVVDLGSYAIGGKAAGQALRGTGAMANSAIFGGGLNFLNQGVGSLEQGKGYFNSLEDALKAVPSGVLAGGVLHGALSLPGMAAKGLQNLSATPKLPQIEKALLENSIPKVEGRMKSKSPQTGKGVSQQVIGESSYKSIQPQAPENVNPLIQEARKQRGFISTVKESQYTSPQTKKLLTDANYTPQPNDPLIKEATRQIKSDIGVARTKALAGDDNQAVANAMELIKHYQNIGDHDQAAQIAKSVAEKLTEHGRAVQAASLYNKLTPEGIVRYAQKEAGKNGITLDGKQTEILFKMAQEANSSQGEARAIKTFQMLSKVQEFMPSKFVDQAVTVWKAGLLSNPTTHLRNIVGTGGMTGLETGKDVIATGLDIVASKFTGKRTKALPSLSSLFEGGIGGAKKALTFLKTGADVDNALGKIDYKQVNLPPGLKQYTQGIFRLLGAEDKVFKEALFKKGLHEMAVVDGINNGLKGSQLESHVKNLYENPTADMVKLATEESLYGTFNNSNPMSTALNKLKSSDSPAVRGMSEFIMPFGRTPANVAARIKDYSPLGFIQAGYHGAKGAGQKVVVNDLARAITGTGIMGAGYGLGKAGMMTGNYPVDPTQRAMWDAQNLQPNALKLGGQTYSMNALSPMGNLLGMGGGVQQLRGQVKPEQYPAAIAALGGQTLVNQTFLQGLSGALNALTDPARSAGTWANSAAAGVVPSIIGATAKAIDPTMRQSNGALDAMQAKIPGLSQGLLPKVDVFGQNRTNNDGSLIGRTNQLWNPFTPREIKQNPVIDEIQRLDQSGSQVSASLPGKQISVGGFKVSLTPEEYTQLEQQTGGQINDVLGKIISQPQYQQASDYDKANVINKIIQAIRQNWNVQNIGGLKNSQGQITNQVQQQIKQRQPFYGN